MSYFQSPRKEIHLIFMGVFCSHCIGKDHFIARIIKLPFEMARTITKIMSDASVSLWVYLRWVTYASQVPDEPHRASAGRCTSWGTCSHAIIHSDSGGAPDGVSCVFPRWWWRVGRLGGMLIGVPVLVKCVGGYVSFATPSWLQFSAILFMELMELLFVHLVVGIIIIIIVCYYWWCWC